MKRYMGEVPNKGASVLMELGAWHGGTWKCSPTRDQQAVLVFYGGFITQSLHSHNWLSHWPLAIEVNLQPLFPPWRSGGGDWKFQTSHHLVGSPNQPHPWVWSRNHHINVTKDTGITLNTWDFSRVWGTRYGWRSDMLQSTVLQSCIYRSV